MTERFWIELNALGLLLIGTVLGVAFADQLWFRDLPCPLCILQRAGFIAAGFGLALNLIFGPRPGHYGLAILGAVAGGAVSVRQILLHIVPGTGTYGDAIFGLHLYTWALIAFTLIVIGSAGMLLFSKQFLLKGHIMERMTPLGLLAFVLFAGLTAANIVSTGLICGVGLCLDDPSGYLLFRENLGLALL